MFENGQFLAYINLLKKNNKNVTCIKHKHSIGSAEFKRPNLIGGTGWTTVTV